MPILETLAAFAAIAGPASDAIGGFTQNGSGSSSAPLSVRQTQQTRVDVRPGAVVQNVNLGGAPSRIVAPTSLSPGMVTRPGLGADAIVEPALFDTVFESGATQTPWVVIAVVGLGAFLLAKFLS